MIMNLVTSFDLVPGVVIDYLGIPAVVVSVDLNHDTEVAYVTLDANERQPLLVEMSWARNPSIRVIGLAQEANYDNLTLFNE